MYGKFLATISPEDWRKEQVFLLHQLPPTPTPSAGVAISSEYHQDSTQHPGCPQAGPWGDPGRQQLPLFQGEGWSGYRSSDIPALLQEPQELLDLFAKLEAENLGLIQQCQQVE